MNSVILLPIDLHPSPNQSQCIIQKFVFVPEHLLVYQKWQLYNRNLLWLDVYYFQDAKRYVHCQLHEVGLVDKGPVIVCKKLNIFLHNKTNHRVKFVHRLKKIIRDIDLLIKANFSLSIVLTLIHFYYTTILCITILYRI